MGVLVASSEMPSFSACATGSSVLRNGGTIAKFPGGADEHQVLEAAERSEDETV